MPKRHEPLRIALTKRAFEIQLMRAGSPKRAAERTCAELTHEKRWQALPLHVRAEIAWKCLRHREQAA